MKNEVFWKLLRTGKIREHTVSNSIKKWLNGLMLFILLNYVLLFILFIFLPYYFNKNPELLDVYPSLRFYLELPQFYGYVITFLNVMLSLFAIKFGFFSNIWMKDVNPKIITYLGCSKVGEETCLISLLNKSEKTIIRNASLFLIDESGIRNKLIATLLDTYSCEILFNYELFIGYYFFDTGKVFPVLEDTIKKGIIELLNFYKNISNIKKKHTISLWVFDDEYDLNNFNSIQSSLIAGIKLGSIEELYGYITEDDKKFPIKTYAKVMEKLVPGEIAGYIIQDEAPVIDDLNYTNHELLKSIKEELIKINENIKKQNTLRK